MPCRSRRGLLAFVSLFLSALPGLPAAAAETSSAEFVIIREGDVFPGDLYAGAINVVVEGTLEGDLVVFAAEEVVVTGEVTGSVTAVTPKLTVEGKVGGSVRTTALEVKITGTVGGDLVAAAWEARLEPGSEVAGDVLVWGSILSTGGLLGEDLKASLRRLSLGGEVSGDVEVSVGRLVVEEGAVVNGDLGYRSRVEAVGIERARVGGAIVHEDPLPPNVRVRALGLLARVVMVILITLASLAVAYGWPERTGNAARMVGVSPLGRWLRGALVVFSPVLVALVTVVVLVLAPPEVAFPLLLVMIPLLLVLSGLVLAASLVAGAPVAAWVGGLVFRRLDLHGAVLAGSLLLGLVWWVPAIGWLVPAVALPLGMGAWMGSRQRLGSRPVSS